VRIVSKLLLETESVFIDFFLASRTREVLACRGWYLSVSHRSFFYSYKISLIQRATFLAGSSSRLLILNGASSKDAAATGGRSGSVVVALTSGPSES
jgi:hypothetical protein